MYVIIHTMEEHHKPVLLSEVLRVLDPKPGESYLDLTAGYAGHASKILAVTRNYKGSTLVDRDDYAVNFLEQKFKAQEIDIKHMDFYSAALLLIECGNSFDLVLADFGVSSPQLDREDRGFSFQTAGPLDMRMDRRQELTAAGVVNHFSEARLSEIFEKYGELSPGFSQKVARLIVRNRPFSNTKELADLIASSARHSRIHPATRVFQAIRIVVNDELGLISRTLPLLPKLLKPGGRVAIITFHSLEDRLVKEYFKEASSLGEESALKLITKSPITAEKVELGNNPRSRSAKLRAARGCYK